MLCSVWALIGDPESLGLQRCLIKPRQTWAQRQKASYRTEERNRLWDALWMNDWFSYTHTKQNKITQFSAGLYEARWHWDGWCRDIKLRLFHSTHFCGIMSIIDSLFNFLYNIRIWKMYSFLNCVFKLFPFKFHFLSNLVIYLFFIFCMLVYLEMYSFILLFFSFLPECW